MLPEITKSTFRLDDKTKLRAFGSAAITADDTGSAVELGSYNDGVPVWCLVFVEAYDTTTGDETADVYLEESSTGSSGWTEVQGSRISFDAAAAGSTPGVNDLYGLAPIIRQKYVRLVVDVGGTTPSITLGVFLSR